MVGQTLLLMYVHADVRTYVGTYSSMYVCTVVLEPGSRDYTVCTRRGTRCTYTCTGTCQLHLTTVTPQLPPMAGHEFA